MTAFDWPLQGEQRQANGIHQKENNETSKKKRQVNESANWEAKTVCAGVFVCLILQSVWRLFVSVGVGIQCLYLFSTNFCPNSSALVSERDELPRLYLIE